MMQMQTAKRPNYSDIEESVQAYRFTCGTCQQTVQQPFLKGLWYHVFNFSEDPYGCNNLIPQEHTPTEKYSCSHDYRFVEDMTKALKCSKCGYALRFDLVDITTYLCDEFHCHTCNIDFKMMGAHIKKHKRKPFEFKLISRNTVEVDGS